jgi:hypothetical protein
MSALWVALPTELAKKGFVIVLLDGVARTVVTFCLAALERKTHSRRNRIVLTVVLHMGLAPVVFVIVMQAGAACHATLPRSAQRHAGLQMVSAMRALVCVQLGFSVPSVLSNCAQIIALDMGLAIMAPANAHKVGLVACATASSTMLLCVIHHAVTLVSV